MSRYILNQDVPHDLATIWAYIARDRPDAADAVVEAAFKTFEDLAAHPHLGPAARLRDPRFKDIRSFPIPDYSNYMIYYRVLSGAVEIIHVYHGARNIDALFANEPAQK